MNGCRHMTADELALMRRLIAEGLTAPQAEPQFPGRTSSTLRKSARWRGLRWPPTIPQVRRCGYEHPPDLREAIRRLWDETDISAREIGEFYGMSKNAIIGMANRGNWRTRQRGGDTRAKTLADRMAELHAMMERVLAENPPGTGRLTERAEAAE